MPDDSDGRSLRNAIRLFSDPAELEEFERLARDDPKGVISFRNEWVEGEAARVHNLRSERLYAKRQAREDAERRLIASFQRKLLRGELVALGMFVRPRLSSVPEVIPQQLWETLRLRFPDSSAESQDVRVVAIRIHTSEEHSADADPYETGLPGRPSIRHLIVSEFERRIAEREIEPTLAAQARALRAWAMRAHPDAPTPGPRTVENHIRDAYREATKPPTK